MQNSTAQIQGTRHASIRRYSGKAFSDVGDVVAVEEPLELQIGFGLHERTVRTLSITMRTPGADRELAVGYLFSEGLIANGRDVQTVLAKPGLVRVELQPRVEVNWPELERHVFTSSSCGVCGATHIDKLSRRHQIPDSDMRVSPQLLGSLPRRMQDAQQQFQQTGGIHAAGLFNASGDLIQIFEDVGRHNALDKLIGWSVLGDRLPLSEAILLVSGRASFELIQKALAAGISILAAVGAPSSLAIDLAQEADMTLAGFTRPDGCNIYSGAFRIL